MQGKTLVNTGVLGQQGNRMIDSSIEFKKNIDGIMRDIEILESTSFISDGARGVAKSIKAFKPELYKMGLTIGKYGVYCVNLSKTVAKNHQNFVDLYKA